jgi:hypothetical protein
MRRWLPLMTYAVEVSLVLAAAYCEPTLTVRGKLHGEAFFEGKSTSWWRRELRHWHESDLWIDHSSGQRGGHMLYRQNQPDWLERLMNRGRRFWQAADEVDIDIIYFVDLDVREPPLFKGDAEAKKVLSALLDDPSPHLRRMARLGLKLEKDGR